MVQILDTGSVTAVAVVDNKAGNPVATTLTWVASPDGLVTAGAVSADTLTAVFNGVVGATGTVTLTATAPNGVSGTDQFDVVADNAPASITITLTAN